MRLAITFQSTRLSLINLIKGWVYTIPKVAISEWIHYKFSVFRYVTIFYLIFGLGSLGFFIDFLIY